MITTPMLRAFRLSRTALASALLTSFQGLALAVPAATVVFVSGEVKVVGPAGASRNAVGGAVVESGETIETAKGRIQLRMVDGAMMSLSERTTLRLDDYHAAGAAGDDERGYMSLVKGALRTISGSIGKARPDRYQLDTPSGTIGIRGTEYTAAVEDGLRVGVTAGRVAVCNDGGCVDVPKGSGAYAPSRAVKPSVSVRVSINVPPTGGVKVAALEQEKPAMPGEGERIARFLAAVDRSARTALVEGGAEDSLPRLGSPTSGDSVTGSQVGTLTAAPIADAGPPPAAPTPAPSAAPAPTQTQTPMPAPAPAPAPAPCNGNCSSGNGNGSGSGNGNGIVIPLASGTATMNLVWATESGSLGSGLTRGSATYDAAGGLTGLNALLTGKKILEKGVPVDAGADGIVAWGRWISGDSKVTDASGGGKGKTATLHYVAFAAQPLLSSVTGVFNSFASTAPTVVSGGQMVAVGELNSARGTVNLAFLTASAGSAAYSLVVPVAGQSFSLTGVTTRVSAFGFSGVSEIRSTGTGCDGGCAGTLGNNVSVIGLVGGAAGNRAGVTYGFDSRIGNVSGVIVFKR